MTQDAWMGLGLIASLRESLDRAKFTTPSPIQEKAIPAQVEGRDVLALAQTGSGKTAAFILPILQTLAELNGKPAPKTARCLILAPTRELAVQIQETAKLLSPNSRLTTLLVLGGTSRPAQIKALARGVDIVIATPGRLTDLMQAGCVRFDETRMLVLDEADRMLDMGFSKQVMAIARTLHARRRTALFSATMPDEVALLAESLMNDPVRVEVARSGETVAKIRQSVEFVDKADKRRRLAQILSGEDVTQCIVFTRTKRGADRVAENLAKDGIPADAIHGNKSQNARQRALNAFKAGRVKVLVASDIASRGIDVPGISHVVQYEMPDEPEAYVHRIGRTGRNGLEGTAIALCGSDERDKLRAIEKLTKLSFLPKGETAGRSPRGGAPKKAQGEGAAPGARSRNRRRRPRPKAAA